jgi:hypothetical protein
MDYQAHYDKLISRSKNRVLEGYYEKHHIIPRCLGGSDNKNNIVNLTPEEHYVAHQLLVKIYPNNAKLINAAVMMIPKRPSNKLYGWLRKKFSDSQKIKQSGSSNSQFGTRWVHNNTSKESKKIGKFDNLPFGWNEGRKINFDIKSIHCKYCNTQFERLCLEVYCSEKCKRHDKSEAIRIIDNNLSEMLNYYPAVKSIDKTLIHFGAEGHRAGNKYFSEILKERNIYVRPRTEK